MDKHKVDKNGFTFIEMLVVLLILSILMMSVTMYSSSSLRTFGIHMMNFCIQVQEKAFFSKEQKNISIESDHAVFDGIYFEYPMDIVCDPFDFHYNFNGNISQGKTILCHQQSKFIKLVFQIGTGRIRVE